MACREGGVAHLQLALGVGLQQSLGRIKGSLVAEGDVVDAPLRHVPGGDIHLHVQRQGIQPLRIGPRRRRRHHHALDANAPRAARRQRIVPGQEGYGAAGGVVACQLRPDGAEGFHQQRGPKLCHHRIVDGLDEPGLLKARSFGVRNRSLGHQLADLGLAQILHGTHLELQHRAIGDHGHPRETRRLHTLAVQVGQSLCLGRPQQLHRRGSSQPGADVFKRAAGCGTRLQHEPSRNLLHFLHAQLSQNLARPGGEEANR
mmetsp:Transcript_79293/g.161237  ORF Transcript_79293/g.161237 Transcript_79293/m.161237 type:complete len:259 (-) Transcript_79293:263-1039(-)